MCGREVLEPRFDEDFDSRRNRAKERLAGVEEDEEENESDSEVEEELENEEEEQEEEEEEDHEGDDLTEAQITRAMHSLDLDCVLTKIRPTLDSFHSQRFNQVLAKVFTTQALTVINSHALPPFLLDYRAVPNVGLEEEHLPPLTSREAPDKLLPIFDVEKDREDNSIKLPMDQFVYLVETTLSLHAFLKYGCSLLVEDPGGIDKYKQALELFIRVLTTTVDRGDNTNRWCLQKMLELVHFLEDVLSYGPASGFSTETGERGLKDWAKAPSKTAQKRGDEVFSQQVCSRIHEQVLINGIAESQPLGDESDGDKEEPVADVIVQPCCGNYVVEMEDDSSYYHSDTLLQWQKTQNPG